MIFIRLRQLILVALCVLALVGCEKAAPPAADSASNPAAEVNAIADRYYTFTLA
jgi:hypothetical protein